MRLEGFTWTEVAERAASSVLAVPVGSTEQHGPHLTLSVDTAIAVELCRRLSESRPDVLVAPAVPYGSSGEHAWFPGTLSIGAETTEAVLVELGRSADAFAGVLFVSAHGGNAGPLSAAVRRLISEGRHVRAWAPRPVGGGDAHAGRTETSVMLALDRSAVRAGVATTAEAAGNDAALSDIMPALRAGGVAAVSPNGVLGDPREASTAEGAWILHEWASGLREELEGWP